MTRVAKPGLPDVRVEIAPTATPTTVSPTWVNVSADLRLQDSLTFNRGRTDERADAQPGTLSLALNNAAGNYTPGNVGGAYHPLYLQCPIRISFRVPLGAFVVMWTGLIDEYSPEWPNGRAIVKLRASDRLALLNRMQLKSWEAHQHLATTPTLLFPLGEDPGATSVGDLASGLTQTIAAVDVGSGGAYDLGAGGLPIDTGSTVLALTPATVANGYAFSNGAPTGASNTTPRTRFAMSVMMNAAANPASDSTMIAGCHVPTGTNGKRLGLTSTGKAKFAVFAFSTDTAGYSITGTTTITDGLWHHVAVTEEISGGNWVARLFVDGVQESSTLTISTAIQGGSFPNATQYVSVGGKYFASDPQRFSGQLAIAAFWDAPTATFTNIVAEGNRARTGATGETSSARFVRVAAFAGLTAATVGTGLSTLGVQPVAGSTVLEALEVIADAELSPLFVSPAGVPTLASRNTRYNAPVVLSVTAKDVANTVTFTLNDQNLVNDVRGSRPGGAELRQSDAASVARYGTRSETLSLIVADDSQLASVVQWNGSVRSTPSPRTPQLIIDGWVKQASVVLATLLSVNIGSRVTVTALPSTAPATTLDLFTEGISDTFNLDGWTRTLNTSAVGRSGSVWQLNSATFSVLGSTTILAV